MTRPDDSAVHGRIDAAGLLTSAEERLAALNARAGGRIGAAVSVPQIADIVRLARRLRVTVSRSAVASDGDGQLDLWVRAEPEGDEIALTVSGWRRRPRPAQQRKDGPSRDERFEAGADWHWETDDALRLTSLSPAAMGALGADTRPLIGAPLTRLFSFIEDADGDLPVLSALAEHRRFDAQLATIRDEGPNRYRLSAVPMKDGRGQFAGFRGSAARIDPPREQGSASGLAADGDAFSARLDEALRSPLGRIIASAEDLQTQNEGPLRSEYAAYATDIAAAGRHLLSLVDDLVDLQAIERPDFRPIREELDLADLGRRAAGLLGVRASAGNVRIDRPDDKDSEPATGEFRRALQIAVNLIGNAVRYAPPDSIVSVRTQRDGNRAGLVVSDQGKGIAPEDQVRIFEKFERVDPSEPGGTGLGLYIARRLARAMGGDIAVESAPGEGARFTLTLPAREPG